MINLILKLYGDVARVKKCIFITQT